jgi:phosphatidylserine/phosphatidylglycerophosphate/cardiolipin synthase-like enzyme
MAASGVQVRVLTNSLAATDVGAVHAGYAKYRKALLEGGVRVYELKPGDAVPPPEKGKGGATGDGPRAAAVAAVRLPACMPRPSRSTANVSSWAPSTSTRDRCGSTPRWA